MTSCAPSNNDMQRAEILYTIASTFEKKNSLSVKLLFGKPYSIRPLSSTDSLMPNTVEYLFLPGQIFGLEYQSTGRDFQKFHHILILRTCSAGEFGTIVPGVNPGAEVLIQALTNTVLVNLLSFIKKIQSYGVCLNEINGDNFKYLNQLLAMKMKTDFFIGELLAKETSI